MVKMESRKISEEKRIIEAMIKIYCQKNHKTKGSICAECRELLEYSFARLERCKYGDDKPACGFCKTICYKPEMRNKINKVMKQSGLKMLFCHPVMTFRHFVRL